MVGEGCGTSLAAFGLLGEVCKREETGKGCCEVAALLAVDGVFRAAERLGYLVLVRPAARRPAWNWRA
jgi:hypothetical protein